MVNAMSYELPTWFVERSTSGEGDEAVKNAVARARELPKWKVDLYREEEEFFNEDARSVRRGY